MAQQQLFNFILPDFTNEYHHSSPTCIGGYYAIIVPVFYNGKVDLSISYNGTYETVHGSEFDLKVHLKSRFSNCLRSVYKHKVSDIFYLRSFGSYNLISPVDDKVLISGLFKYFMVIYVYK